MSNAVASKADQKAGAEGSAAGGDRQGEGGGKDQLPAKMAREFLLGKRKLTDAVKVGLNAALHDRALVARIVAAHKRGARLGAAVGDKGELAAIVRDPKFEWGKEGKKEEGGARPSVQQRATGSGLPSGGEVHQAATEGLRGPSEPLPHREAIQRSFGRHDVSGIQAHVGGPAQAASEAMGARAYASGDAVAFRTSPDLHTAAHEAAHVMQQKGGVQLAGGVGTAGDRYEQHADAVADAVVSGRSAEALLDGFGGGGANTAIQRAPDPKADVEAVKSKEIEGAERAETTNWPGVAARGKNRKREIEAHLAQKPKDDVVKILDGMKSRWDGTVVMQAGFDPVAGKLDAGALRALIAADQADAAKLAGAKFKNLVEWVTKLATALEAFLKLRQMIGEEKSEFHRFDAHFLDADVKQALAKVPGDFRPADLKAMLAQETGDFTDANIGGLEGKKGGIVHHMDVNTAHVGIGQVGKDTEKDARAMAAKLGVTLPASTKEKDARKDPATGIKMVATYLAYVGEKLTAGLPKGAPLGVEMRKLVIAAYNGGPFGLIAAAKQMGGPYTWEKIAQNKKAMSHFLKPGEVRDYVTRVMERAP